jgi:hypothetical protein
MWKEAVFIQFNSIHRLSFGGTGENKGQPPSKQSYETDIYCIYRLLENGAVALDICFSA